MDKEVVHSEFLKAFPSLIENVIKHTDMGDMPETNKWLEKVLQYNVPHGKLTRGLTVVLAYKKLNPDCGQEDIKLTYIMGWAIEIMQASFLIADDIMDNSVTRRGRSCWYRVENNGATAINDAMLLESLLYQILKVYFREKPYYLDLMEFIHDVVFKTLYGQSFDTRIALVNEIDKYDLSMYKKIAKYKTSYYSFYCPVWVAMTMAGLRDQNQVGHVEKLCLDLGFLFQVQDDYLDCFGDFAVTGKIGTDIQEAKCTWLFVKAMEKANPQDKCLIKEMYGSSKFQDVKKIYEKLKIDKEYRTFEEDMYFQILESIEVLPEMFLKELFLNLVDKMYRRAK